MQELTLAVHQLTDIIGFAVFIGAPIVLISVAILWLFESIRLSK
jgi:hypothetical protein